MRFIVGTVLAALAVGCATLPEVHPWFRVANESRTPTVVGPRGPLTRERAEVVLARLAGQGKTDLLSRHIAIEGEVSDAPLTLGNAATLRHGRAA